MGAGDGCDKETEYGVTGEYMRSDNGNSGQWAPVGRDGR